MENASPSPSLKKLIGQTIIIRSIVIDEQHPAVVKLLNVETGGIWIESQKLTNHFLSEINVQQAPKTLVAFVPFQQIAWIFGSIDSPALSEKSFGV